MSEFADYRGNYAVGVEQLLPELHPGEGYIMTVLHDDWCLCWGGLPCDCEPEFVVKRWEAPE